MTWCVAVSGLSDWCCMSDWWWWWLSSVQAVEDVHVTYEDQQRINNFATNMRRMTELKNELEAKKVSPMLSQEANSWTVLKRMKVQSSIITIPWIKPESRVWWCVPTEISAEFAGCQWWPNDARWRCSVGSLSNRWSVYQSHPGGNTRDAGGCKGQLRDAWFCLTFSKLTII